jgi:ATP-dependent helicase/nuclease subunit B
MRDDLAADPLVGPRLLLLVPEQAGMHMERSLVQGAGAVAVCRAEVLGFRRLAQRILASVGSDTRTAVSPAARSMLLRLVLSRNADKLRYYGQAERLPGFVEKLASTLSELITEAIDPDELADTGDDFAHASKMHDLRLIYASYLDALGSEQIDPTQYLDVARSHVDRCSWLTGARIWVDGFAGFTGQERLLLAELARVAKSVDITVLVDPEAVAAKSQMFERTRRVQSDLIEMFAEHGVTVDDPLELRHAPFRFSRSPALASIEANLFGDRVASASAREDVRIVEASDRRVEAEFAVSQVLAAVQRHDDPLRFRDVAIIVRDLEPYHALLSAALDARGIPYFIDRRQPVAHHPLVELIRGVLEIGGDDLPIDPVRRLLRTGFFAIDDDAADVLENHLLATGLCGRSGWIGDDWPAPPRERDPEPRSLKSPMDLVNAARRAFLDGVGPWLERTESTSPSTGAEWADALGDLLSHLGAEDRIEGWAVDAEEEGELGRAELHRQLWRDLSEMLDDLKAAMGDQELALSELTSIIEAALFQWTVALAPPMLDQVLVGSIERSRHPDIKMAIVLGFNDGVFPSSPAEDPILNDDDRTRLLACDVSVARPRRQRVYDELLLAYIAFTRPSESLTVSYALADEDGAELQPSPYLDALRSACGDIEVERVGDPYDERSDRDIHTSEQLASHLCHEFRHRPAVESDDTDQRERWNDLYEEARRDEELSGAIQRSARSLVYDNHSGLSDVSKKSIDRRPFHTSVTALETYAQCPFKHFAHNTLKLKERAVSDLDLMDVGTLHHAILERFISEFVAQGTAWSALDDAAIFDALSASYEHVRETKPLVGELSSARDRYLADRSRSELGRVLKTQKSVGVAGAFRPKRAELSFGFDKDESLPALVITTPKGRDVRLRGYIDRVDLAEVSDELLGVVIDYKRTRKKKLDLSEVYHGLSLQLLAYLLVLAERGETIAGRPIVPAGVLYMSIIDGYRRVKHPSVADTTTRESSYRPRGLLNTGKLRAIEADAPTSGWSPTFALYRTKDGGLGYAEKTDGADANEFSALLKHTRLKLGAWADQLLDGVIDVAPFRHKTSTPCSWCSYRSVCRYEVGLTKMRVLPGLKRSDVLQLAVSSSGGAST